VEQQRRADQQNADPLIEAFDRHGGIVKAGAELVNV
jgi:hypothetical protein